uniref:Vav 3 guanine nucleotide exchange factor b n=1 Tax=Nothobranchius furzeri TaxID=105023 RepID=A0A8C6VV40_NOTFU
MEYWRQCAMWLIGCNVLPANHRVTADSAQVFDLAQTLRDGVLLCQLLNNLKPQTINLKEINLRPQMSQFLCLKNIRTFLNSCCEVFGMKKNDLFDAFDLFDVRDFGKVRQRFVFFCIFFVLLLRLNYVAAFKPTMDLVINLSLCVENIPEDEDDLYAAVYGLDQEYAGGEIYEDLMKTEQQLPLKQVEVDVRSCCLSEIKQTEERYTETLESIEKYFLNPLKKFLSVAEIDNVFVNIPDLVKLHKSLMVDVQDSILNKNALNLHQIFIDYKERLLIYGIYCSRVEIAIAILDLICKEKEDVRLKLEECSKRANNGKFTLRDLLVVPMQRVLKYHLLLQDLAQYVNEVKRDNETLREIDQYQRSIENLNQPLLTFGRPKGDGEVRLVSNIDKRKQDRHIFLFDVAAVVCKRRGDNYEMKDILDLNLFKVTNNPTSDREGKKWCYGFYVTHQQGHTGFELFFKTRELKKKWLEQFEMAISNIHPEKANHNSHQFKMHTFEKISSCSNCRLFLRGIFNQGYLCLKCGLGAHKECLGRLGVCGRTGNLKHLKNVYVRVLCLPGLPRMIVIKDYSGIPSPQCGPPLSIHAGDVIELMFADLQSSWWQGKNLATSKIGFFPSDAVRPYPCVPKPADYSAYLWFAGLMERYQAELELMDRDNSTYLVRHRSKELNEYAISIKFNDKVKHIKILTKDGCFYVAESRLFKTVLDLVEYYKEHSLKEGFSSLDTTLQVPYRELWIPVPQHGPRTVFSPRVVGVAVARYDFCSKDIQELTLQKGDIIRIYTKMPNGWWKGEVDGRVGWFPSTYVEEED